MQNTLTLMFTLGHEKHLLSVGVGVGVGVGAEIHRILTHKEHGLTDFKGPTIGAIIFTVLCLFCIIHFVQ